MFQKDVCQLPETTKKFVEFPNNFTSFHTITTDTHIFARHGHVQPGKVKT